MLVPLSTLVPSVEANVSPCGQHLSMLVPPGHISPIFALLYVNISPLISMLVPSNTKIFTDVIQAWSRGWGQQSL